MQHNLQLEMGGEQDMDRYCSLLFQKLCASEAQLPVAGSSLMSNQAGLQTPEWHLLVEGNHNSQDASTGIDLSPLEPDPLYCISN